LLTKQWVFNIKKALEVAVKYCFDNKSSGFYIVDKNFKLKKLHDNKDMGLQTGLYLFHLQYAIDHVIVKSAKIL